MNADDNSQVVKAPPRENGLDVGRLIALYFLMYLHAPHIGVLGVYADLLSRFVVPMFFISAGYFSTGHTRSLSEEASRVSRRLLLPFAFWALVYILVTGTSREFLGSMHGLARVMVDGGAGYHLWFLTSLALNAFLLNLLKDRVANRFLLVLALLLYSLALVLGNYYLVFTGVRLRFNVRDGPFFGLPLMIVGLLIKKENVELGSGLCWALFLGGASAEFAEFFWMIGNDVRASADVLLGTIPFGVGAFLLSRKISGGTLITAMAALGRYSLGIYAIHLLVMMCLQDWFTIRTFVDEVQLTTLTFFVSISLVFSLSRIRPLRIFLR